MNKRTTMTYAVAAGAAATLLLAGCNGGDEDPTATPTPTNSSTSSASPSGSPSPTATSSESAKPLPGGAPTQPAAAKAHSESGAVEFSKWFVKVADAGFITSDSQQLKATSGPNCVTCTALINGIDQQRSDGTRQVASGMTPTSATAAVPPEPNPDKYYVDVTVKLSKANIEKADGTVTTTTDEGQSTWRLTAVWSGSGWLADALEVL